MYMYIFLKLKLLRDDMKCKGLQAIRKQKKKNCIREMLKCVHHKLYILRFHFNLWESN